MYRHCQFFDHAITRRTWLFTKMVTTGSLPHGDVARHMDFSGQEHPVARLLGGSDPADWAHCARLAGRHRTENKHQVGDFDQYPCRQVAGRAITGTGSR